ncbi:SRPBCC family protein [Streptoalloteichus hindustanus]|uniref:Polyketide cyclase / dehydrase and lipid transport n=1 Tax=Streptoalloteichus hindustanus TaxID=2017 RepID=A0A1M5CQL8_STRHI|nr:SRPBCC family protein [Streptoalloteichus hindustanus]SHF56993.1 Polyketide cyclase / dehydrase and lipid transport [Streptoalloteichus hindustanus]
MNVTTPSLSPSPRTRTRLWSALLALPLATGLLGAAVAPAHAATSDQNATPSHTAAPESLTCRGAGIDPTAKLHHRTEIFIKAPLSTVWKLHTDLEGWPSWQTPVTSMKRLDPGPLRKGSRFQWTTPAPPTPTTPATTLVITSAVQQIRHNQCVRWSGPAIGEGLRIDQGIHVWNFVRVRGGVIVRTEESWTGAQIEADPATSIKYLAPGLDAWLAALKTAAEAHSCDD